MKDRTLGWINEMSLALVVAALVVMAGWGAGYVDSAVAAQTPPVLPAGVGSLAWDMPAPTLATAQAYAYYLYEGAVWRKLLNVTCTGAVSPFPCKTPMVPLSLGAHTLTMTAVNEFGTVSEDDDQEGPKSAELMITISIRTQAPLGIRIEDVPPPPAPSK